MGAISKNGAGGGTRTLTHSRAADFESAASAISPLRQKTNGAGEGNRTLVASLEGWSSAIELRPLSKTNGAYYTIFTCVNQGGIGERMMNEE